MKARFVNHELTLPRIEIMPNTGTFESMDGRVVLYPGDKPRIVINATLHHLSPQDAYEWVEVIKAAAMLSEGKTFPSWDDSLYQAYRAYWFTTYPAPLPVSETRDEAETVTFAGSVDYGGAGDGQALEEIY